MFLVLCFLLPALCLHSLSYLLPRIVYFAHFLRVSSICLLLAPSCFPGLSLPPFCHMLLNCAGAGIYFIYSCSSDGFASHIVLCWRYSALGEFYIYCLWYQISPVLWSSGTFSGLILFTPERKKNTLFVSPVRGFMVADQTSAAVRALNTILHVVVGGMS